MADAARHCAEYPPHGAPAPWTKHGGGDARMNTISPLPLTVHILPTAPNPRREPTAPRGISFAPKLFGCLVLAQNEVQHLCYRCRQRQPHRLYPSPSILRALRGALSRRLRIEAPRPLRNRAAAVAMSTPTPGTSTCPGVMLHSSLFCVLAAAATSNARARWLLEEITWLPKCVVLMLLIASVADDATKRAGGVSRHEARQNNMLFTLSVHIPNAPRARI